MYEIKDIIDKVHCADCLEFMEQMPNECVDLIFADPDTPWTKDRHMDYEQSRVFAETLASQMKRVLKPNGQFYVNTDHRTYSLFYPSLKEKFTIRKDCIAWNYDYRHIADGDGAPRAFFDEYLIHGVKSNDADEKPNASERTFWVLSLQEFLKEKVGLHGSQKPMQLMNIMVVSSSKEDDLVLAPFSGSGSMEVMCKGLKRHFIGIEIQPEHCKTARKRLEEIC